MPTREEKQGISDVLSYARRYPVKLPKTMSEVQAMRPVGDNPKHWTEVKVGKRTYRIVFSYEEQKIGLCRHISMSEMSGRKVNHGDANMILHWFEFRDAIPNIDQGQSDKQLWYWEQTFPAFNVVELVDPEASFATAHIGTAARDAGGMPASQHEPAGMQ